MTLVPAAQCIEAALAYARRGWRVLPIPPGKQHPSIDRWEELATCDPDVIRGRFSHRELWQGVSIATGPESGIFVVDVDVAEDKAGDETLADLEHEHGALPATYEVVTARGGRHLYFRWPTEGWITNDAGLRLGPGLDVRGAGGQVVAPPAYSSKPGWEDAAYEVELDAPDEPAQAPLWLVELLCAPLEHEPRRQRPEEARTGAPGDLFEAAHGWAELLEADGARCIGERYDRRSGSSYELWARPGVDDHHGATLYYGGSDVLKVFTSSWPGLTEGATYTRFGYYAATRWNGDHSAAARQLREEGYVPQEDSILGNWTVMPGEGTDQEYTYEPDNPDTWPEPTPFPGRAVDPWPVDVLPEWMREHAEAVAMKLQVPVDLCAQLALGVLSTVTMGHVKVRVDRGWEEYTNLYLVTAMLSGTGKSPAVKVMAHPVYELERQLREQVGADTVQKEREKALLVQKAKNLEKVAAAGSEEGMRDYLKALADADEIEVPVRPQLLVDDITPERLAVRMEMHKGRMSYISPEGELFDMVRGAYSKRTNINIYLKGWAAEPVRIERKGTSKETSTELEIEEALLAVCIAVQPSILEEVARDETLSSRGFTTRFMPAVPEDLLGNRNHYARRNAPDLTHEYSVKMVDIGKRMRQWQMPLILELSEKASELFVDWQMQLELRMNRSGELRHVAEWASKIVGSVARTAGLLQVAEGWDREPISEAVMGRAIRLGEYWIRQAVGLTTGLWEGSAVDVPRCERVLRWVRRNTQGVAHNPQSVHIKGVSMQVTALRRAMRWSAEETEEVIGDLCTYNCAIIVNHDKTGRVGRPKGPELVFNPHCLISANTAISAKSNDSLSLSLSHVDPYLGGRADLQESVSPMSSEDVEDGDDGDGYSLI